MVKDGSKDKGCEVKGRRGGGGRKGRRKVRVKGILEGKKEVRRIRGEEEESR